MDHDLIVEQLLARCKCFIENILQAADLHSVATASLAIFEPMRQVAREILQAKIQIEAQQLKGTAVAPCCQDAGAQYVHTRTVSPQTLLVRCTSLCGPSSVAGVGPSYGRMTSTSAGRTDADIGSTARWG